MTERITERDLVLPTLYCISTAPHKTISTAQLIEQLRELLRPSGAELEILKNRGDDKFSQKVRNLRSHQTLEKLGLCTYEQGGDGTWKITTKGEAYLIERQDEIKRIELEGAAGIEKADLQQDVEESLVEGTGLEYEDEDVSITKPFDPTKIRIITRTMTVDLVMKRINENEIILDPEFQRAAGIWKNSYQSSLIESILLRVPLPAFYMDATDDDKWIVIDGLQRLTTLQRFILTRELRLEKLEFLKDYNNFTFDDLPRNLRRRIEETQLTVYLVERGTPPDVKINIFKRINTHGTPLSNQEIRHALNLGHATRLLKELADSEAFGEATDYSISPLRMADRECILRFLAFTLRDYHTYKDDLDTFLVDTMKDLNQIGQTSPFKLEELKMQFYRAMRASVQIFEVSAFRKVDPDSNKRSPVSKALFEVWSVNLCQLSDAHIQKLVERRDNLNKKFKELLHNTAFVTAISYATGDAARVQERFSRVKQIIEETLVD